MVELILGECVAEMRRMPSESVDMILTDPPYGISFLSNWQKHQKRIENDNFERWAEIVPLFLREFYRVLKERGCCCCFCGGGGKTPVTAMFTMEAVKHFHLIQTVVWRKSIGLGWRYRPSYENVLILSKSKDKYNFYDTSKRCSNVVDGINRRIPRRGDHPTVKPISLMEHFLKIHSLEGDVVLDPFMGCGSTGQACKNLNRNFIGIEIDKGYFNKAKASLQPVYNCKEISPCLN